MHIKRDKLLRLNNFGLICIPICLYILEENQQCPLSSEMCKLLPKLPYDIAMIYSPLEVDLYLFPLINKSTSNAATTGKESMHW